jgi:hypothetical protein
VVSYDCYCDYDPPDFYHREIRKARKPHKCDECAGIILPGDQYEHVRGKWEDCISTFETCGHCVDIRTWVKNNVPCLCWAHGNTIEDCKEAIEEAIYRTSEETRGLRFGFLRRLVQRDKFYAERRA